jgi:hypothetical protein
MGDRIGKDIEPWGKSDQLLVIQDRHHRLGKPEHLDLRRKIPPGISFDQI